MSLRFEINPGNPLQTLGDIIPMVELLADCIGFSGDNFVLGEDALTGLTETLCAIALGLKAARAALRNPAPTGLRAV